MIIIFSFQVGKRTSLGHFYYQLEKERIRGTKIFLVVSQGHAKRPAITAIPSATGASNIPSRQPPTVLSSRKEIQWLMTEINFLH